ncbi:hypothetical protein HDR59_04635 [bacterium]|nr:hypothetical protein [bacterium]
MIIKFIYFFFLFAFTSSVNACYYYSLHPNGSTTITMKDKGSEKEQITHATIGSGNITVGGESNPDLEGLNRDVSKSQEITKDKITGALDGSMTIDNRILLGWMDEKVYERDENGNIKKDENGNDIYTIKKNAGWNSIIEDNVNLGKNLIISGIGAYGTVMGTVNQIYDVLSGEKNLGEAVQSWKANQSNMATGIKRGSEKSISEILDKVNKGIATPEEIQLVLNYTSDGNNNVVYSKENEINQNGDLVLGANDSSNSQGYVNLATGNATDNENLMLTDYEERSHNYTRDDNIANSSADYGLFYQNLVAGLTGNTQTSSNVYGGYGSEMQNKYNSSYNTNNNLLLNIGTNNYNTVNDINKDYRVYHGARDLDDTNPLKTVGNHSFVIMTPDNPEDFTTDKMEQSGLNPTDFEWKDLGDGRNSIISAAFDVEGNLQATFNHEADVRAVSDYYKNGKSTSEGSGNKFWDFDVELKEIKPKEGISDTEFIYNLLHNTVNYKENTKTEPVKYSLMPSCFSGYNCNSFSNSLLQYSGSGTNKSTDFKGVDAGKIS